MSLFPTVSYQKDLMLSLQFKCIVFFNTLIFVSSTYRVYFIIFFLKSAVFTIKKEPFPSLRRMVCFLLSERLMIKQSMCCLVDVFCCIRIVHGVEMHTCNILSYQVHDLVHCIGKSCCSERLRVMLILV